MTAKLISAAQRRHWLRLPYAYRPGKTLAPIAGRDDSAGKCDRSVRSHRCAGSWLIPAARASSSVPSTRSTWRREVLLTWQWCMAGPGLRGGYGDLTGAVDRRGRVGLHQFAHVGEGRRAGGGHEPRHGEVLRRVRARRVAHQHAEPERTGGDLALQQVQPRRPARRATTCAASRGCRAGPSRSRTGQWVRRRPGPAADWCDRTTLRRRCPRPRRRPSGPGWGACPGRPRRRSRGRRSRVAGRRSRA
jgi:hypothetical protein